MFECFLQAQQGLQFSQWLNRFYRYSSLIFVLITMPIRAEDALPPLFIDNSAANEEFIFTTPTPATQIKTPTQVDTNVVFDFPYDKSKKPSLELLWQKTLPRKNTHKQQGPTTIITETPIEAKAAIEEPTVTIEKAIKEQTSKTPIENTNQRTTKQLAPKEQQTNTVTPPKPIKELQAKLTPPALATPDQVKKPVITIVIDDLGYNRQGMTASLNLPTQVTLAILPNTPFSKATAKASVEQGRTIILHTPMENTRQLELGPGGLYTHMQEKEFKQVLTESINSVPGITGINNHMGSLLTQSKQNMRWVMETIKPKQLFFIDSVTSGKSVAYQQAKDMQITTVKRNVFLDNLQNEAAIHKQFERLIRIAKKEGRALAIGHPYPSTMAYLQKRLPKLVEEGIELISINDYMQLNDRHL